MQRGTEERLAGEHRNSSKHRNSVLRGHTAAQRGAEKTGRIWMDACAVPRRAEALRVALSTTGIGELWWTQQLLTTSSADHHWARRLVESCPLQTRFKISWFLGTLVTKPIELINSRAARIAPHVPQCGCTCGCTSLRDERSNLLSRSAAPLPPAPPSLLSPPLSSTASLPAQSKSSKSSSSTSSSFISLAALRASAAFCGSALPSR